MILNFFKKTVLCCRSHWVVTIILLLVLLQVSKAQTSWSPSGAAPYLWSNPSNWTAGVPNISSNVTISGATVCTLDVNPTIAVLTFSGNLDLNGHSMSISSNNAIHTFTNGMLSNSGSGNTLTITSTGTGGSTITGTTFGSNVNVSVNNSGSTSTTVSGAAIFNGTVNLQSPDVYLNGATFNGAVTNTVTVTKTGATGNTWVGGNTFNVNTIVNNQGAGDLSLGGNMTYNGPTTISNSSIGTLYTHRSFNTSSNDNYNDNVTFQNSNTGNLVISTEGTGQSIFAAVNATSSNNTATITNNGAGIIEITRSSTSIFNGQASIINSVAGHLSIGASSGALVYFLKGANIFNTSNGTLNIADSNGSIVRFGYNTDNVTTSAGGNVNLQNTNGTAYRIGNAGSVYFSGTSAVGIDNNGSGQMFISTLGTSVVTFGGISTLINNNSTGTLDIGDASGSLAYFLGATDIFNNSSGALNISNAAGSIVRFGYMTDNVSSSTGGTVRLKNLGAAAAYTMGNMGNAFFSQSTNTTISNENSGNITVGLNYLTSGTTIVSFDGPTSITNSGANAGYIFVSLVVGTNTSSTSVTFNNAVTFQNTGAGAIFAAEKTTTSAGSANITCQSTASFDRTNGTIFVAYGNSAATTNATIIFNGDATFSSNWSQGIRVAEQPASASALFRSNVTLISSYNPGGGGHSGIEFGMGGGSVTIDGGGNQTITHGSSSDYPSYVGSLLVNKPTGLLTVVSINTAQPVLEVESAFALTSGIVKTNRATNYSSINLGTGVTAPPGGSSAYFDGPISKTFNNTIDFDFHVGCGTVYRRLSVHTVSASAATLTTFVVEYKKENWTATQPTWGGPSTWPPGYVAISGCEYWWLDRTIGTASVNSVTLTWKSNDCPATYIGSTSTLSELKVTKWNGINWVDLGGTSYTGDYTAGSVTSSVGPITTFSPFTIASTSSISLLPITLSVIGAKVVDGNVSVYWATSSEINNDHFEIERSSNGTVFTKIGTVIGHGTTTLEHEYSWLDQKPLPGLSFYRLRQIDYDGESTHSKVISISNFGDQAKGEFSVYPIPATDKLFLSHTGDVKISDVLGNVVFAGHGVNEINVEALTPGVYVIIRKSTGEVLRFVKN